MIYDFDNYDLEDVDYDFSNLMEYQTGIKGVLTIYTKFPNQIPNLLYYKSTEDISLTKFIRVSISNTPDVVQDKFNIVKEIDNQMIDDILKWVTLNYQSLLFIWDNGIDILKKNDLGNLYLLIEQFNLKFIKINL